MAGRSLQKDVENTFNIKLLSVPLALREMNWLEFLALGGSEKALETAASMDADIQEITKLASEVMDTPLKTVRKARKVKQAVEAIEEETGTPVLPAGKRSRQEDAAGGALEPHPETLRQKRRTAKASAKKAPAPKRSRPPSARTTQFSKRPSKANLVTPVGPAAFRGATPTLTPKFDSSIFKTPGLRAPAAQERVFSISANGSPLADGNEIFLTLPMGGGESIRVRASELCRQDLMRLNVDTLGTVQKMSTQLLQLCSSVKGHH
ncbi:Borealin [Varanus komodoensis]|uniref:borealin n=1 Tax=Varanus komodoensis TaxID=61221 RepID=UPI001CF7AC74|nr:borealin [Varanus komodoensis]KAF7236622.1 Borealin [Varanus komodoensis]